MSELKLRSYQAQQLSDVKSALDSGDNYVILQSPTGSGKNFMMAYIMSQIHKRNGYGIFAVAGRNVASQFTRSLDLFDVPWSHIMSGNSYWPGQNFYVASIDTLISWFFKKGAKHDKETIIIPDYLLLDECRLLCTKKREEVIKFFGERGAKVIGFDATPVSPRLHCVFQKIVHGKSTPWHIEAGNLSPVVHYSPAQKDLKFLSELKELKLNAGEYSQTELSEIMNKKVMVGDIVNNYEKISMKEYGSYESFVVACVDKKHARSVQEAFLEKGHEVEYIDGETPQEEREKMFRNIAEGKIIGIISVLTMAYGVDIPSLKICINARPSKQLALFLQLGGRVLRNSPGKTHAVFVDHAAAIKEHGYIDDEYIFTLDPKNPVENKTKKERSEKREAEVDITCANCTFSYKNSSICPKCGHQNIVDFDQHNVVYLNSDLVEAHHRKVAKRKEQTDNREWIKNMKAEVWRQNGLKTDTARVNTLNDLCRMKFKEYLNPQDLLSLPFGTATQETSRYMTGFNIRKSYRSKKRN